MKQIGPLMLVHEVVPGGYSVKVLCTPVREFCSVAALREYAPEHNIFLLSMLSVEMIFS